ncbi:MAG: uroporphyrinogen decarboxylase family protein [Spirochaetota bacterium]
MNLKPYIGEPDIERLFSAFKREKVDRVPNFEVLIEDQHVEKLLGRYAGNTLSYGGDPAKGVSESEGARPMKPKDYIDICKIIGQDAIIVEAIWTPFKKRKEDGTTGGLIADRSIKTREDFKKYVVLPSDEDIEAKMVYVREYKQALAESGTKIGFCVLFAAFFQTLYEFVIGLKDCMTLIYNDRDFIEELLEISTDWCVKLCNAAIRDGVDFIWPADDVAFKTGLFLPPKLTKEIWAPRMKRIIEPALSAGKPVMFHSDGNIDDLMPMLLDMGVDCVHPMDPYGINYREFKKKFGSAACLAGNIDIEFPLAHGTPEDVEKDVKEHMAVLKPGGGYVCCSSHSIVNYIPHENYLAMLNAIHRYGTYEEKQWVVLKPVSKSTFTLEEKKEKIREEDYLKRIGPDLMKRLFDSVYKGDSKNIGKGVRDALNEKLDPMEIISKALTPAIRAVGAKFSTGEMFLPELLMASNAMQEAMKLLTPLLKMAIEKKSKGKILIGTIKGDLHDIGKNIVKALLEGNGFEVIDIGIDNAPEKYIAAINNHQPVIVGYSGLLSTTLGGIKDQMEALKKAGLRDKVITIVGGAPVTQEFAERNGVDLYGKDANEAVLVVEKALKKYA